MKVLHLTTWKEPCGIAGYAEDLVAALTEQGVRNEVFAYNQKERKYLSPIEFRAQLKTFCANAHAHDLVHIQHEFAFFHDRTGQWSRNLDHFGYLLKSLQQIGKPVVVTFHTEPVFLMSWRTVLAARHHLLAHIKRYLLGPRWRGRVARYFSGAHPQFRALVHSAKSRLNFIHSGFGFGAIETIPVGMKQRDQRTLDLDTQTAKQQLGYAREAVLLSLFGFIMGYKGHEVAIKALQNLPEKYHLAIVGGPHPAMQGERSLNHLLSLLAGDQGLKARVRITGYAPPATVDLYHAATDICLMPYRNHEQSGSAGLSWALSSGKPVIASKIPCFMEINDEADCMLMVSHDAEFELAWHIERLAADAEKQQHLVRNALKYVEQNSWSQVARTTMRIYEKMLAQGAGPRAAWAPVIFRSKAGVCALSNTPLVSSSRHAVDTSR